MRSFIFSSRPSRGFERQRWGAGWLVAGLLFASAVAVTEFVFLRHGAGLRGVVDTPELWFEWREEAAELGREALILVGASRIQLGIDLDVLHDMTGMTPVQLAIDGSSPLSVLLDLSQDERITGTVLVSLQPGQLLSSGDARSQELVDGYWRWKEGSRFFHEPIESRLRELAFAVFPSRAYGITLHGFYLLRNRQPGASDYLVTFRTREREADYSKVNARLFKTWRLQEAESASPPSFEESSSGFRSRVAAVVEAVARIRSRGGNVVFVQMPVAPELYAHAEARAPRERYWNAFAAEVPVRTVHFMDHERLQAYELPDGSHLDVRDQKAFTRDLAQILFGARKKTAP